MKLVGHSLLMKSLFHAAASGRLHPVSIFGGSKGVVKKLAAIKLAQLLVCEEAGSSKTERPCEKCGPCVRIDKGQSESLLVITPSGPQLKIEDVRPIHEFLRLQGLSRARVLILEDAHLMNPTAANHLLKILEEPPSDTYFFFVTDHPHALLPTIRSRSQTFRFGNLAPDEIKEITGAPDWICKACQGRADVAIQLSEENSDGMRQDAAKMIELLVGPSFVNFSQTLKEKLKDRAASAKVLAYAQQIVSDGFRAPQDQVHTDLAVENFTALPKSEKLRMFASFLSAERDIEANMDRQAAIEKLWFDFQKTGASHVD